MRVKGFRALKCLDFGFRVWATGDAKTAVAGGPLNSDPAEKICTRNTLIPKP